jgi:hypothetical protein
MTLQFASRPQGSPLPGAPVPYFLSEGDSTGGFERFFSLFGEPTDARTYPEQPLGIPPMEKFIEASRRFDTKFMPDYRLDT